MSRLDVKKCPRGFSKGFQGQGCVMVSWVLGIFDEAQPDSYKSELLPADVPKMSVEVM